MPSAKAWYVRSRFRRFAQFAFWNQNASLRHHVAFSFFWGVCSTAADLIARMSDFSSVRCSLLGLKSLYVVLHRFCFDGVSCCVITVSSQERERQADIGNGRKERDHFISPDRSCQYDCDIVSMRPWPLHRLTIIYSWEDCIRLE